MKARARPAPSSVHKRGELQEDAVAEAGAESVHDAGADGVVVEVRVAQPAEVRRVGNCFRAPASVIFASRQVEQNQILPRREVTRPAKAAPRSPT